MEKKVLIYSAAVSILGTAFCLCLWMVKEYQNVGEIPRQIEESRKDLIKEMDGIRSDIKQEADAFRMDANSQLTAIRIQTLAQVGSAIGQAHEAISILEITANKVNPVIDHVSSLTAQLDIDVKAIKPEEITAMEDDAHGAVRDSRFLLARGARAVGHLEQTMDVVEASTKDFTSNFLPGVKLTINDIGKYSVEASQKTADTMSHTSAVMANFEKATKPLPTWVRIGLAVAPPAAQAAAGVATVLAVTGVLKP